MKKFSLFWKVDVNIDEVAKPLEWWKENEARFLDVGSLAWQFITLFGSQIETDHAFNVTSFFTSLQWCRLDTSNLDSFIMIYKKWSMMHAYEVVHGQNMIYKNFLQQKPTFLMTMKVRLKKAPWIGFSSYKLIFCNFVASWVIVFTVETLWSGTLEH
jgi:hypothetical protein